MSKTVHLVFGNNILYTIVQQVFENIISYTIVRQVFTKRTLLKIEN